MNIKTDTGMAIDVGSAYTLRSTNFNVSASELGFSGVGRFAGNLHGANMITPVITLNSLNGHVHGGVNTGSGSTAPYAGSGASPGSVTGPAVTDINTVSKTNVLSTFADEDQYERNTEGALTVVGRLITFEPCPEHKNK
jgi:hypothetical protein